MRDASFFRLLNPPEWDLVRKVFGGTLPPREEIGISDGLGDDGRPWTYSTMLGTFINFDVNPRMTPNVKYVIELGNLAATDLTSTQPTYGPLCANFERICDLFIHEMTHVWHYRYHHELRVLSGAYYAQKWGAGYAFTPGQPWKDYNFEQQAHIVETWHQNGMRKTKDAAGLLYPYVNLVVRAANKGEAINYSRTLPLDKLWEDQLDLQRRGKD